MWHRSEASNLRPLQKDTVNVDLGYVVNAGFSVKWGSNVDEDNQFAVRVLVQVGIGFLNLV